MILILFMFINPIIIVHKVCPDDMIEIDTVYQGFTKDTLIIHNNEWHYVQVKPCYTDSIPDELYIGEPFIVHSTDYPSFVRIYYNNKLIGFYEQYEPRSYYLNLNYNIDKVTVSVNSLSLYKKEVIVKKRLLDLYKPPQ
jgi:hypothetical protein